MKAPVVALFLLLEVTQALWLNADAEEEPSGVSADASWGPPAKPPTVVGGNGASLNSGEFFALESETEPGMFVTLRAGKPEQMGAPMRYMDMRHITNGPMGLDKGITTKSTFSMQNRNGDAIKSGDLFKWIHGANSQIDLLTAFDSNNGGQQGYMWPHPIVKKNLNKKEAGDFLIEHAREVDLEGMKKRAFFLGAGGFDQKVKQDPRIGEGIKDGDSVWIRHKSSSGSTAGDWLYMSGDPAEGYHVAFPHHFPGFDGRVKHYGAEHWSKGGNDGHATSSRFTVRKVTPNFSTQQELTQQKSTLTDSMSPLQAMQR